jgi:hypothetical protein
LSDIGPHDTERLRQRRRRGFEPPYCVPVPARALGGALLLGLLAASCSNDAIGPSSTIDAPARIVLRSGDPLPDKPVVEGERHLWSSFQLREPGNAVHDPLTDRWIMAYSGQIAEDGPTRVGASYSDDGLTWSPDPHNPITGNVGAEDPYLVRRTDGDLYRDPDRRALMFTEQKSGHGLDLWRSGSASLSGWTRVGPVLAPGPGHAWDGFDRSSPVVVAHRDRLIMLFEGRGPGNAGEIGYATSLDDGLHWSVGPSPILRRGGDGSWNEFSVVPDDLLRVGSKWVLFAHGARADAPYMSGRYVSSDELNRVGAGSFVELPGNPFDRSNSVMPLGNDPGTVVWLDRFRSLRLASVHARLE